MSSFSRVSFSFLFPLSIVFLSFLFDFKISSDSTIAFRQSKEIMIDNILNEKEISNMSNSKIWIIRLSDFEIPDSESSFLLRYKIPFLRKEGYPEQVFNPSIN